MTAVHALVRPSIYIMAKFASIDAGFFVCLHTEYQLNRPVPIMLNKYSIFFSLKFSFVIPLRIPIILTIFH